MSRPLSDGHGGPTTRSKPPGCRMQDTAGSYPLYGTRAAGRRSRSIRRLLKPYPQEKGPAGAQAVGWPTGPTLTGRCGSDLGGLLRSGGAVSPEDVFHGNVAEADPLHLLAVVVGNQDSASGTKNPVHLLQGRLGLG